MFSQGKDQMKTEKSIPNSGTTVLLLRRSKRKYDSNLDKKGITDNNFST